MNSLAPIISLSETLTERVARTTTEDATSPVMLQALEAIHRRSKGLLEFVQNYRKLTRIPAGFFGISDEIEEYLFDLGSVGLDLQAGIVTNHKPVQEVFSPFLSEDKPKLQGRCPVRCPRRGW